MSRWIEDRAEAAEERLDQRVENRVTRFEDIAAGQATRADGRFSNYAPGYEPGRGMTEW